MTRKHGAISGVICSSMANTSGLLCVCALACDTLDKTTRDGGPAGIVTLFSGSHQSRIAVRHLAACLIYRLTALEGTLAMTIVKYCSIGEMHFAASSDSRSMDGNERDIFMG